MGSHTPNFKKNYCNTALLQGVSCTITLKWAKMSKEEKGWWPKGGRLRGRGGKRRGKKRKERKKEKKENK